MVTSVIMASGEGTRTACGVGGRGDRTEELPGDRRGCRAAGG